MATALISNFIIFLFGLMVGSFLNSVIYRLEKKEGFLFSRSYCPHCRHTLAWSDLIPVLSFIILRGKCRYCQKPISWQYPLVEIATGSLFFVIFQCYIFKKGPFLGISDNLFTISDILFFWVISAFLIVIFVYDLKHYIIPNRVLYPAIAATFLYRLFENLIIENWKLIENWSLKIENLELLLNPMLAAILASTFFLCIVLISRGRWMGVGDVKLAFLLGLLLGWPKILVALFLAFFLGAVVGTGLIIAGKKTLKSEVPFGPFLVTGTFLALFFGQQVIHRYLSLFMW